MISIKLCNDYNRLYTLYIMHVIYFQSLKEFGTFKYIQDNSARMRDVELLTGLRLVQKSTNSVKVRLLTHLAVGLWDRLS